MQNILPTDTFNTWIDKTNAFITEANDLSPISNTLTLNGVGQIVTGTNRFTSGIVFGSEGGPVVATSADNLSLTVSHNLSVLNNKGIIANSINATSGEVTLNGNTYIFPSTEDASEGYFKTDSLGNNRYNIDIIPSSQILSDVAASLTGGLTIVEELIPVGAIMGFRSISTDISDEDLWLKCNGSAITYANYPELYVALGGTAGETTPINIPDLDSDNVLIGQAAATGALFGDIAASSGTSYFPVVYYIKARGSQLVNFSFTANNSGITFRDKFTNNILPDGVADLSTGGAKISLDVNPSYFSFAGNTLTLNASTTSGANTLAVRDSTGVLRSASPPNNPDSNVVATVGYVNALSQLEHKFKGLNSRGFNSYSIAPPQGLVCVDIDNHVYGYGINTNLSPSAARFGDYGDNAYGHNLALHGNNAIAVYADETNTYVKYQDGKVYSTGANSLGKAGVSPTANRLKGPTLAFDGLLISDVILSYDDKAETAYALTTDGKIKTYGNNTNGQLGNAASTNLIEGYPITKAWLIGGGKTQTGYALRSDKTLWACGYGARGQMGRFMTTASNPKWVPVCSPDAKSWANLGVTGITYNTELEVYIATPGSTGSTLQTYDRVKIGNTYYTVEIVPDSSPNVFFKLYNTDSFTGAFAGAGATVFGGVVYVRMADVVDAYFGGTGSDTFGFVHRKQYSGSVEILNLLYSWGYNHTSKQLGLGPAAGNTIVPTLVPTAGKPIASVYTGLDYAVHLVTNAGKLLCAGDNSNGLLGISGNNLSSFAELTDLSLSGLPNTSGYTVHKFFSSGNTTRFCVFKSLVSGSQTEFNYRLTGWGSGSNNRLGVIDNQNTYSTPIGIEVRAPQLVYDIQTSNISGTSVMTLLLQRDESFTYGDLYTCGRIHYNFNSYPNGETIPYFTKVKNV